MKDRRRMPRYAAKQQCLAVTKTFSARCMIEDISALGARLVFTHALIMPWKFKLRFEDGEEETVQVIWRKGAIIGVSFWNALEMIPAQKGPSEMVQPPL